VNVVAGRRVRRALALKGAGEVAIAAGNSIAKDPNVALPAAQSGAPSIAPASRVHREAPEAKGANGVGNEVHKAHALPVRRVGQISTASDSRGHVKNGAGIAKAIDWPGRRADASSFESGLLVAAKVVALTAIDLPAHRRDVASIVNALRVRQSAEIEIAMRAVQEDAVPIAIGLPARPIAGGWKSAASVARVSIDVAGVDQTHEI
jgi:hypothetical protein